MSHDRTNLNLTIDPLSAANPEMDYQRWLMDLFLQLSLVTANDTLGLLGYITAPAEYNTMAGGPSPTDHLADPDNNPLIIFSPVPPPGVQPASTASAGAHAIWNKADTLFKTEKILTKLAVKAILTSIPDSVQVRMVNNKLELLGISLRQIRDRLELIYGTATVKSADELHKALRKPYDAQTPFPEFIKKHLEIYAILHLLGQPVTDIDKISQFSICN